MNTHIAIPDLRSKFHLLFASGGPDGNSQGRGTERDLAQALDWDAGDFSKALNGKVRGPDGSRSPGLPLSKVPAFLRLFGVHVTGDLAAHDSLVQLAQAPIPLFVERVRELGGRVLLSHRWDAYTAERADLLNAEDQNGRNKLRLESAPLSEWRQATDAPDRLWLDGLTTPDPAPDVERPPVRVNDRARIRINPETAFTAIDANRLDLFLFQDLWDEAARQRFLLRLVPRPRSDYSQFPEPGLTRNRILLVPSLQPGATHEGLLTVPETLGQVRLNPFRRLVAVFTEKSLDEEITGEQDDWRVPMAHLDLLATRLSNERERYGACVIWVLDYAVEAANANETSD